MIADTSHTYRALRWYLQVLDIFWIAVLRVNEAYEMVDASPDAPCA